MAEPRQPGPGGGASQDGAAGDEDQPVCRVCWQAADSEPGGRLAQPCRCTAGVHDGCLMRWLLAENGRVDARSCEACLGTWQGTVTVPIPDLVAQAAALKQSVGARLGGQVAGREELAAALEQMQELSDRLAQHRAATQAAEAHRHREHQRMLRVAAYHHRLAKESMEEERRWRRSLWHWAPALALVLAGAFCAGAHCQHAAAAAAGAASAAAGGSGSVSGGG